jgi:hypothetical protein
MCAYGQTRVLSRLTGVAKVSIRSSMRRRMARGYSECPESATRCQISLRRTTRVDGRLVASEWKYGFRNERKIHGNLGYLPLPGSLANGCPPSCRSPLSSQHQRTTHPCLYRGSVSCIAPCVSPIPWSVSLSSAGVESSSDRVTVGICTSTLPARASVCGRRLQRTERDGYLDLGSY